MSTRSTRSISSPPSLLEQMFELPVDTLATENSYYNDKDTLASLKYDFKCGVCHRVLASRAGRVNHEKKHKKQQRRAKFEKTIAAKRGILHIYQCEICGDKFTNKSSLTKHTKKHPQYIKCQFCNEKFVDKMDFEWHDTFDLNQSNYGESPAKRTRSKSRMSCRYLREKFQKRAKSCEPVILSSKMSVLSGFRPQSRISTKSAPQKRLRYDFYAESEFTDSEFCESYISDGRFSEFYKFNERTGLDGGFNYDSQYDEVVLCSELNCGKSFSNVDWLSLHEITDHKKLALFRCTECRRRYTSNENLEKHKLKHYQFVHIKCVLCNLLQPGRDIVIHQRQHLKIQIVCNLCGMQFLDDFTYQDHLTRPHLSVYPKKVNVLFRVNNSMGHMSFNQNFDEYLGDFSFSSKFEKNDEFLFDFNELEVNLPWRF